MCTPDYMRFLQIRKNIRHNRLHAGVGVENNSTTVLMIPSDFVSLSTTLPSICLHTDHENSQKNANAADDLCIHWAFG
jgi:hypothetical protein